MVLSATITDKIRQVLSEKKWRSVDEIITNEGLAEGKRTRKLLHEDVNFLIIDAALKNNRPEFLSVLRDINHGSIFDLFGQIIGKYITTRDAKWLSAFYKLTEKLDRKSTQSRIFGIMAKELISAGVSDSNAEIIDQGLKILDNISFRKYRSGSMIDIVPLLIPWAVASHDVKILYRSQDLIHEISDISKRAVLHAEISQAIATIAIHQKNYSLYCDSIQNATGIHQKLRRKECISVIIENGAKSAFGKRILDISKFIRNFSEIPLEVKGEIIDAVTGQILDRIKDKDQINRTLVSLCTMLPFVTGIIILKFLWKAEKSGDIWYLSNSIEFRRFLPSAENFPLKNVIHAAIIVARHSRLMSVLSDLIPLIETTCDAGRSSRIYLQFTRIMLSSGDFDRAVETFENISPRNEILSLYTECLTYLLSEGLIQDRVSFLSGAAFKKSHESIFFTAVYKAITNTCRETSLQDIVRHLDSFYELILLHPRRDLIIFDCITTLVNRGFLDAADPDIMVKLAESIRDRSTRERAISAIVIKIAKIGVRIRNRDFLQRAVGITCLIEDQNTRSAALGSIIDDAATLAAAQGDLDLLLRMRTWSSSLLDDNVITYTIANIVDGVIKYATEKQSPAAVEEAYLIAQDITDPLLRTQMCEQIAECLVKIGCIAIQDQKLQDHLNAGSTILFPFSRGLQLLKNESKKTQLSLKIARMIDIILSYSRKSANPDYILPLALLSVEIENPYERHAMMSRIVSNLNDKIDHPDSADPYEIMVYLLQKDYHVRYSNEIIYLIVRLIHNLNNPYVKEQGLCNLAESCIRLRNSACAGKILDEAYESVGDLPTAYQKLLILTDLTALYCHIDPKKAKTCLDHGLQQLERVESEWDGVARRQIVIAMVNLHAVMPKAGRIPPVLRIIEKIADPAEFVHALTAAYSIIRQDKSQVEMVIQDASEAINKISSPYEKALLQLELVPLAVQSCDNDTPLLMIGQAEELAATIKIPFIADAIRDDISSLLMALSEMHADKTYREKAIEVLRTIDDYLLRSSRLSRIGIEDEKENTTPYGKILAVYTKVIETGTQSGYVTALEQMVRSVANRGKEAFFFCSLSILFRENGDPKMAKKMLHHAIQEAIIIRPLSRRAYVLCDIAMKVNAAGCENAAQRILERAMDAATNIRQSPLRDTVFNELGLAIRIMQGLQE